MPVNRQNAVPFPTGDPHLDANFQALTSAVERTLGQWDGEAPPNEPLLAAPEGLAVVTSVDINGQQTLIAGNFSWNSVPNAARYLFKLNRQGDPDTYFQQVNSTTLRLVGLKPNQAYTFTAAAIDIWGRASADSDAFLFTTPVDETPPNQVTGLTVSPGIRTLIIHWDASDATDLRDYQVQVASDAGFSNVLESFRGESTFYQFEPSDPVTSLTTYHVRVRARDQSLNEGAWSATVTGQLGPASGAQLVDYDIDVGTIRADKLVISAFENYVEDPNFDDFPDTPSWSSTWDIVDDPGNAFSGKGVATQVGQGFIQDSGNNLIFSVAPGEKFLLRFYIKAEAAANGQAGCGVIWRDADGQGISQWSTHAVSNPGTSYALKEFEVTVPAAAAKANVFLTIRANGTQGRWWIGHVTMKRKVGTAFIEDLAVTDAKIANLTADKITTGVLSAVVTISGNIQTASSGQRVQMNSGGITMFDSGGTQLVRLQSSGTPLFYMRSGATGQRVQMDETGLRGWNASGEQIFRLQSTGKPFILRSSDGAGSYTEFSNDGINIHAVAGSGGGDYDTALSWWRKGQGDTKPVVEIFGNWTGPDNAGIQIHARGASAGNALMNLFTASHNDTVRQSIRLTNHSQTINLDAHEPAAFGSKGFLSLRNTRDAKGAHAVNHSAVRFKDEGLIVDNAFTVNLSVAAGATVTQLVPYPSSYTSPANVKVLGTANDGGTILQRIRVVSPSLNNCVVHHRNDGGSTQNILAVYLPLGI